MDIQTFAAERRARLEGSDEYLQPKVRAGLERYSAGEADWAEEIVDAAAQVWLENFEAEAPGRPYQRPLTRFRQSVEDSLEHTSPPGDDVDPAQVHRITQWLSTYAVNAGTITGAFGRGVRYKMWVTMQDSAVRESHDVLEGEIRPIGSTFTVAGTKVGFPGEPVGPPDVWINCRCVLMPASREGQAMTATTYTIGPEDDVEDDNPNIITGNDMVLAAAAVDEADIAVEPADEEDLVDVDEPEDGEELITEIPVHGVLAPEGVATGDGREFAIGALSTRDLPIPLRHEVMSSHGGTTSDVVTVGRIDQAWRDDATDSWRFTGVVVLTKPFAQDVIDGIIDGTIRGVSIDGDDAEVQIEDLPEDAETDMMDVLEQMMNPGKTVFSKMRVSALTIVPIPAFQEAYIALGHEFQEDLSAEEQDAQVAALQSCGCLEGWHTVDLSEIVAGTAHDALAEAIYRDHETLDWDVELASADQGQGAAELEPAQLELGTTFAPGTKDGPGWITHPVPTARIRRYWSRGKGAAKIRWGQPGDFNRCRSQLAKYVKNPDWLAGTCANLHKEALGFWPAQHHGARVILAAGSHYASEVARLSPAAVPEVYPSEWFQDPGFTRATPLKIDRDTRRISGYVAEWGSCHVGIEGMCRDVPRSYSDYAYFKKGVVDTDAGEQPVGVISYGFGHAGPYDRIAVATAHYDQPDAVRAYVNLGEDEFGIWFSGVLTPDATEEDITKMRAIGAVSGDWREIRGAYELIGIPVVNTPGFPLAATLAASGGKQISLIGVGALAPESLEAETLTLTLTDEAMDDIAARAVVKVMHQQRLADRASAARAYVRTQRLAAARAQLERI